MELIEFKKPLEKVITVYSKSGCPNCKKVKDFLQNNSIKFTIVDCDEYLIDSKTEFLNFVTEISNRDWRSFPIVFEGEKFIGGFIDTKEYIKKQIVFDNNEF